MMHAVQWTKRIAELQSPDSEVDKDTPNYDIGYLAACVCSRLVTFYFARFLATGTLQGTYSSIYPEDIRKFTIRRISFITPLPERARLLAQAVAAHERGVAQNEMESVLALVAKFLAHDPEQSDVVHDLLAQLAGQMMELNKEKQARAKAFWDDMEGATDRATFKQLHDKGKQESSLYASSDAFQPFLRESSHATRRLDEALAWNEDAFKSFVKALTPKIKQMSDLVSVFSQHSPRYREITGRLHFTDAFIDEIVYRLYGLSAEEIAVIRGRD